MVSTRSSLGNFVDLVLRSQVSQATEREWFLSEVASEVTHQATWPPWLWVELWVAVFPWWFNEYGGFTGFYGILWDFMGFYRILWDIPSGKLT